MLKSGRYIVEVLNWLTNNIILKYCFLGLSSVTLFGNDLGVGMWDHTMVTWICSTSISTVWVQTPVLAKPIWRFSFWNSFGWSHQSCTRKSALLHKWLSKQTRCNLHQPINLFVPSWSTRKCKLVRTRFFRIWTMALDEWLRIRDHQYRWRKSVRKQCTKQ